MQGPAAKRLSNREIISRITDILNSGDFEAMEEFLAPDVAEEIPQSGERIRGSRNQIATLRLDLARLRSVVVILQMDVIRRLCGGSRSVPTIGLTRVRDGIAGMSAGDSTVREWRCTGTGSSLVLDLPDACLLRG